MCVPCGCAQFFEAYLHYERELKLARSKQQQPESLSTLCSETGWRLL